MFKPDKNQPKFSGKLQPFGANYLTRLNNANSKLICNLSRAGASDCITDPPEDPVYAAHAE